MDGQPVSSDDGDVAKGEHGRSYMSNRTINQSAVPGPLAMRAKAPVFSTEDGLYENRVGGNSEQSIYPIYPRNFKAYVPTTECTLHPIESTTLSQSIELPGNDRLI